MQLLIEAEGGEDAARLNAGALEPFGGEEALDDVRVLDRVQVVPVGRVLLADRHEEAAEPSLELVREARRGQVRLLDGDRPPDR